MSRYIDAEWLLNFFEPYPNDYQTPLGSLRACVDDAPSVDIVRCAECVFKDTDRCPMDEVYLGGINTDDFCSYGEREGE